MCKEVDNRLFRKEDMTALIQYCCKYFTTATMDKLECEGMYNNFLKDRG